MIKKITEKYVLERFVFSAILILVQRSVCRELHTTEIKEDSKWQCPSSTRSIYTVASEMQCYQRCLRKEKCEILNYKGSSTKENCEVFEAASDDNACAIILKANWKAVTMKRKEKKNIQVHSSCKDVKAENPRAANGIYHLKSGDHYCIMDNLEGCGEGGWTVAMSLDGDNDTFGSHSSYWEDNSTYNVENGLKSFENEEAKFPAFSSISFTSICLGMKKNGIKKWLRISKSSSSLLNVFKGAKYQSTSLGRATWMSLVSGANLQAKCNREGFNGRGDGNYLHIRIGILGKDVDNCSYPKTFVGFGSSQSVTCGSTGVPAMGYILIQ